MVEVWHVQWRLTAMILNLVFSGIVSCFSRSQWNKFQISEKCIRGTNTISNLLWWIGGLFSAVESVVWLAQELQMRPQGWRDGLVKALGSCWASASSLKWPPPGRQMVDYVGCSHVPMAQLPAPEESTSWALNHPRSSGVCRHRSQQWNQNLLFQMERQTMHNMSQRTLWDRLVQPIKEVAADSAQW